MDNLPSFLDNYVYNKRNFLLSIQQRFSDGEPEYEMLNQSQYWSFSIPHESSGPCYTYDPPFDSQLAETSNMFIEFNMSTWDPLLEVFLHDKNQLFYSRKTSINTKFISSNMLRATALNHPRALSKHCFRIN